MVSISGISNKIFSSKLVKSTVKFASDNPALFASSIMLFSSSVVRPVSIIAAPKADKDDKKYAVIKSLASSLTGFGLTYAVSKPIERAVKNIDKNPNKFLKKNTIDFFQNNNENILKSRKYLFATQFFKNSAGLLTAVPKSMLTCALIPVIANSICRKNDDNNKISFGKNEHLSNFIASLLNTKTVKSFSEKFSGTNLIQSMSVACDVLLTTAFIKRVHKSKEIPDENKKPLINNSILSTALSIVAGVGLNKISDKPVEKFINYFLKINKDIKNPQKYAEGIRVIKTVGLMSAVYYGIIPILSTAWAGILKQSSNKQKAL
jgi:hypothetical protein